MIYDDSHLSDEDTEECPSEAAWFWPVASLAPEVPSIDVLNRFLDDGPDRFQPVWLRDQIQESACCRRTLDSLRRERLANADPSAALKRFRELEQPPPARSTSDAHSTLPPLPSPEPSSAAPAPASIAPPQTASQPETIRIGDLRCTRGEVLVFRDGLLQRRQTFRPLRVVVVDGPFTKAGEDYYHCWVCSTEEEWPGDFRGGDDVVVRLQDNRSCVVHLWLEKAVSRQQLARRVGVVEPDKIKSLRTQRPGPSEEWGWDTPPDPFDFLKFDEVAGDKDEEELGELGRTIEIEQEQLRDCATWLSCTLEAALAHREWQQRAWRAAAAVKSGDFRPERVWEFCGLAAAANRGLTFSSCVFWDGPLTTFHDLVDRGTPEDCQIFPATCLVTPKAGADPMSCTALWSLPSGWDDLDTLRFAILHPDTARLLGWGRIQSEGNNLPLLAVLEVGLTRDLEAVPASQMVLLIPKKW